MSRFLLGYRTINEPDHAGQVPPMSMEDQNPPMCRPEVPLAVCIPLSKRVEIITQTRFCSEVIAWKI